MKAVILCGGMGKRLRPVTIKVPKAMVPIHGKPFLERIIGTLYQCGIRQLIIVTGHLGHQIEEFLQDGDEFDVEITYVNQECINGSASALDLASNLCKSDFLVSSCDVLLPTRHIKSLIEAHHKWKAVATLSLIPLETEQVLSMNTVALASNNRVSAILEKPSVGCVISNVSATSMYIFSNSVFEHLRKVPRSSRNEYEITSAISLMIGQGLPVKYVIADRWLHLSRLGDLKQIERQNSISALN